MAVNKVEINGQTVLDLTQDTVTPETLKKGVTAHSASGEKIVGTGTDTPVVVKVNAMTADRYQFVDDEGKATLDLSGLITGDCFICIFHFAGETINEHKSFDGSIVLQHDTSSSNPNYDASGYGLFRYADGTAGVEYIQALLESGSDHVYDISSDFSALYDSEGNSIANCDITMVHYSYVVSWS